jgi:vacuolar-type H+-ATPase subunit I/STV1
MASDDYGMSVTFHGLPSAVNDCLQRALDDNKIVTDNVVHKVVLDALADSDFVTMDRLENFIDRYDLEGALDISNVVSDAVAEGLESFDIHRAVEDVLDTWDFDEVVDQGINENTIRRIMEDNSDVFEDVVDAALERELPEAVREYGANLQAVETDIKDIEDMVARVVDRLTARIDGLEADNEWLAQRLSDLEQINRNRLSARVIRLFTRAWGRVRGLRRFLPTLTWSK